MATPQISVVLRKPTSDARVGVKFMHSFPDMAIVHSIANGSIADNVTAISSFRRVLSVNGQTVSSALDAVSYIRHAPAGELRIVMTPCPAAIMDAASVIQRYLRHCTKIRTVVLSKPERSSRLGIVFFPLSCVSLVSAVRDDGLAAGLLQAGEEVLQVQGQGRRGMDPGEMAYNMREAIGEVRIVVRSGSTANLKAAEAAAVAAVAAMEAGTETGHGPTAQVEATQSVVPVSPRASMPPRPAAVSPPSHDYDKDIEVESGRGKSPAHLPRAPHILTTKPPKRFKDAAPASGWKEWLRSRNNPKPGVSVAAASPECASPRGQLAPQVCIRV